MAGQHMHKMFLLIIRVCTIVSMVVRMSYVQNVLVGTYTGTAGLHMRSAFSNNIGTMRALLGSYVLEMFICILTLCRQLMRKTN